MVSDEPSGDLEEDRAPEAVGVIGVRELEGTLERDEQLAGLLLLELPPGLVASDVHKARLADAVLALERGMARGRTQKRAQPPELGVAADQEPLALARRGQMIGGVRALAEAEVVPDRRHARRRA